MHYLSLYAYSPKKLDFPFYNINYKKEEILNKTTLSQLTGIFLFILGNEEPEENKLIRLRLNKELHKEMQIGAAGFKEIPTTDEELGNEVSSEVLKLKLFKKEEDYIIYEFPIENPEVNRQKYIIIGMMIIESLDYLSFYIGPES